jgi:protein-tyrosine phosphatase
MAPVSRAPASLFDRAMRFALTNPLSMAIKAPVRDLVWSVQGRGLENPVLRSPILSILFVCKGNICRSPFAALLASHHLSRSGSATSCVSAGISTTQANRSPQHACEAARHYGIDLESHRPIQLTRALISSSDLIAVMEASQLLELRASYPEAADRVFLLSLLDDRRGYSRYNIADPFGESRKAFDACYERINVIVERLLQKIGAHQPDERPLGTP